MSARLRKFIEVGSSSTSESSNTERAEISVTVYVGENGYVQNAGFVHQPITALEKRDMTGPVAIVLHRTVSSTASSALNAFASGIGTHFLIDKDGTIYQTASLNKHTAHVGPIRSRCLVEGTCPPDEARRLATLKPKQGHDHEKTKIYPDRYPMNEDSIGIEVVAMYHPTTKVWDTPTSEQSSSIRNLIEILKRSYALTDSDIYPHDTISRKTEGEGQGLYSGASDSSDISNVRMPWQRNTHP